MKLYGLALAGVPSGEDPASIKLICNPLYVEDAMRHDFTVLREKSFTRTYDFYDGRQAVEALEKVVYLIDKLVTVQRRTLQRHGLPYVPVVLDMGEDRRNPLNPGGLMQYLFSPQLNADFHTDVERPLPPGEVTKKELERRDIHGDNTSRWRNYERACAEEDGLAEYRERYKAACNKLSELMEFCTIKLGSYKPLLPIKVVIQKDIDKDLISLRKRLHENDPKALVILCDIARHQGFKEAINNPGTAFAMGAIPDAVKAEPDKYPRFHFYNWDPKILEAYREGYADAIKPSEKYTYVKTYTEPDNQPFTDPVANGIMEQCQVLEGARLPQQATDNAFWRKTLIGSAKAAVEKVEKRTAENQAYRESGNSRTNSFQLSLLTAHKTGAFIS